MKISGDTTLSNLFRNNYLKIVGLIAIIVSSSIAGYFLLAFETIGYNDYGLKRNDFTSNIDDKVYEKGFYHKGLFHSFLKFPKTVQKVEFFDTYNNERATLDSRTNDGLLIHLQLAFHYKLRKSELIQLYSTFGMSYEDSIVGQARTTLRDATSHYNAIEFFNNRTVIGEFMQELLDIDLDDLFCDIAYLQLREIDLPDEFEDALKRVQIAQQEYQIAIYEQEAALVRAQTTIFEAQAKANITLLSATAEAEAYVIQMQAEAESINITLSAQNLAYYAIGQQLNLTSTELLSLLWIMAIMNHDESLLIIGENTPLLISTELEGENTTLY